MRITKWKWKYTTKYDEKMQSIKFLLRCFVKRDVIKLKSGTFNFRCIKLVFYVKQERNLKAIASWKYILILWSSENENCLKCPLNNFSIKI